MKTYKEFRIEKIDESATVDIFKLSIDYVYCFRIVKILYQKWEDTQAFKLGLIDKEGKKIKAPATLEERAAYSPFIALVFNIKRILGKVPGGNTKVAALAASYMMMKEHAVYEDGILPEVIDEVFESFLNDQGLLNEDTPVMTTAAIPSTPVPIGLSRKKWKDMPKFAGKHTFEVNPDLFDRVKSAKIKGEKWDKYIKDTDGEEGQNILKFKNTYPNKPIMLKRKNLEVYTNLKQ